MGTSSSTTVGGDMYFIQSSIIVPHIRVCIVVLELEPWIRMASPSGWRDIFVGKLVLFLQYTGRSAISRGFF